MRKNMMLVIALSVAATAVSAQSQRSPASGAAKPQDSQSGWVYSKDTAHKATADERKAVGAVTKGNSAASSTKSSGSSVGQMKSVPAQSVSGTKVKAGRAD